MSLLVVVIYLSFISLGLPDSLLGSAWPSMYSEFDVSIDYSGYIFATISICTVISALLSSKITNKFSTKIVTVVSIFMTVLALLGFSVSSSYWMLVVFAIPYGLGAGSIDAALNNYVAIHFESKHMSWLHCMWGIGTMVGPFIMSRTLTASNSWQTGYRIIAVLQEIIGIIVLFSLPLWKDDKPAEVKEKTNTNVFSALKIKGVIYMLMLFFAYCALEQTVNLWASGYLTLSLNVTSEKAAGYASMFFIGITIGRALSGFITAKLNDDQMVNLGLSIIGVGVVLMLLPVGLYPKLAGLVLIGLGCAPIYPCMIHATPNHFGEENSQNVIGLQMASAYVGTTLMPPLAGKLINWIGANVFPYYLLMMMILIFISHQLLVKTVKNG